MSDQRFRCLFGDYYFNCDFRWSLNELSDAVGITRNHLYNIRLGLCMPSLLLACRLVNILNFFYRMDGKDTVIHLYDVWPDLISAAAVYNFYEDDVAAQLDIEEYNARRSLDG